MRLGILGDAHHRGQDLAQSLSVQSAVFRAMRDAGVQVVLDAGDTFDRSQIGDRFAFPGTVLAGYLQTASELDGIPMHVIEGNHTLPRPGQHGPLSVLASHPCISVYRRPCVVDLGCGVVVGMLPWASKLHFCTRPEIAALPLEDQARKFQEACRGILLGFAQNPRWQEANSRIVLGHAEVSGATTPHGYMLEGETFRFSGMDLEAVNANLVALGHYHKRQPIPGCPEGYYIGALRQLNHGEEGNPTGWLLVDTETGELDWREVDCPRYYTIPALEFRAADFRPEDKIKLRGAEAPAELPTNVIFEKAVTLKEAQVRVAGIDPTSPVTHLLAEWAKANAIEIDPEQLTPLVNELGGTEAQGWKRGCLDRLISVRLAGIGPHVDTFVHFQEGDWWALCGANGVGKTWLVEAPIACWYGCWAHPKRPSLYDVMTQEQATIEVVWESAGKRYRMTRRLRSGKSQRQEAYLTELTDGTERALAGPKVADAEVEVGKIVGPKQLLLAGPWLTQKAEGDLVLEDASGRKDYMRKSLNVDIYDPMAAGAKTKASELDGALRERERLVAELPSLELRVNQLKIHQNDMLIEAGILEEQEQEQARTLASLREQHVSLVTARDGRAGKERAVSVALDEQTRAGRALLALGVRRGKLEEALAAEPALKADLAKLEAAKQALEDGRLAHQAQAKRRAERAELQAQQAKLQSKIRDERRKMEALADGGRRSIQALREEIARAQASEQRLQGVGCAANLLPCRLIDSARAELAKVPALRDKIASEESLLDQLEYSLNIEQDYAQAEQAELAELELKLSEPSGDSGELPDLRLLQARVSELEQVERKLGALEKVSEQLEQIDRDSISATEELEAASRRLLEAERELAECPAFDRDAFGALVNQIRSTEESIRTTQAMRRDAAARLGAAERDVNTAEAELARARGLEEALKQDVARRDGFRLLERAFGRDGIPQLLISAAIPAIQDILNEVCLVDFQGRFSVRLDTLRQTKTSGSKESFDILFSTGGQEYDARGCSGGEEAAVRAALRTALVLYQAGQAADSYRVAVLDEPAAHQDAENAEATMALLARLRERFRQVIVVSHSEDMLAGFAHRITLEKGPRGTRVAGQEPIKTEEAVAA